jgi:hypothetical protein
MKKEDSLFILYPGADQVRMGGHDNIPPVQIIDMETIISIVRRREHLFPIFGFRFPVSGF